MVKRKGKAPVKVTKPAEAKKEEVEETPVVEEAPEVMEDTEEVEQEEEEAEVGGDEEEEEEAEEEAEGEEEEEEEAEEDETEQADENGEQTTEDAEGVTETAEDDADEKSSEGKKESKQQHYATHENFSEILTDCIGRTYTTCNRQISKNAQRHRHAEKTKSQLIMDLIIVWGHHYKYTSSAAVMTHSPRVRDAVIKQRRDHTQMKGHHNIIRVPKELFPGIKHVLEWIHCGKIFVTEENFESIIVTALYFHLKALREKLPMLAETIGCKYIPVPTRKEREDAENAEKQETKSEAEAAEESIGNVKLENGDAVEPKKVYEGGKILETVKALSKVECINELPKGRQGNNNNNRGNNRGRGGNNRGRGAGRNDSNNRKRASSPANENSKKRKTPDAKAAGTASPATKTFRRTSAGGAPRGGSYGNRPQNTGSRPQNTNNTARAYQQKQRYSNPPLYQQPPPQQQYAPPPQYGQQPQYQQPYQQPYQPPASYGAPPPAPNYGQQQTSYGQSTGQQQGNYRSDSRGYNQQPAQHAYSQPPASANNSGYTQQQPQQQRGGGYYGY